MVFLDYSNLIAYWQISTGTISGAEALLRWHREDEGFVSPSEFVPLAEEPGLASDLRATLRQIDIHPGYLSLEIVKF
jgi:sensor c-di-GMP phosphodiesterase-like protein